MSGEIDHVREALGQLGSFTPRGKQAIDGFFSDLHTLYDEFGSALTAIAEHMHEDPAISNKVADMIRELAGVTSGVGGQAHDTYAAHTADHAAWLED